MTLEDLNNKELEAEALEEIEALNAITYKAVCKAIYKTEDLIFGFLIKEAEVRNQKYIPVDFLRELWEESKKDRELNEDNGR